ncbi:L-lactate dehydrogenase B-B chain-like isoform X2 [Vespa velutina]|uniref:L-lactate dehydrogenase B-B chain-like isoform X2 n=1 Tax=Vespa velutina TaxID=202808 RepID=UPI001FB2680C|nr:L-lactate dehydrogenase B-B chain-like isoform X2 [Vespa velutina]
MVLTLHLSSPFLRICLKNWEYVTSRRSIGINRRIRDLPPTILKDILNGKNDGKVIESASFTGDASCGSEKQRTDLQPVCLREELLCKVSNPVRDCCHKVSIVGAGMVGIGVANAILFQKIASHVAIVDAFPKKLEGEGMDLSHGSLLIGDPHIEFDTDFCITSNSRVVIICAGIKQQKDETRLDLTKRNTDIFKTIIPPLLSFSPNAVFVIASNPVDILSYVTWKVSGLPYYRVIGCGTHIDTCRFRYLISDRLGIAPSSVNGIIIGEHGDSQDFPMIFLIYSIDYFTLHSSTLVWSERCRSAISRYHTEYWFGNRRRKMVRNFQGSSSIRYSGQMFERIYEYYDRTLRG